MPPPESPESPGPAGTHPSPGLAPSPRAAGMEIMPSPWFPAMDLKFFGGFLDAAPQADETERLELLARIDRTPLGALLRLLRAHEAHGAAAGASLNWDVTLTAGYMLLEFLAWADGPEDPRETASRRRAVALRLLTAEGHSPVRDGAPPALPRELAAMRDFLLEGAGPGPA
ncbi:MAG: hypothetical protein LBR80_15795, partial [Deltaproteobacteria bacterium]|nr:hypothetical protein [Deltaproteobacteria bacterium]